MAAINFPTLPLNSAITVPQNAAFVPEFVNITPDIIPSIINDTIVNVTTNITTNTTNISTNAGDIIDIGQDIEKVEDDFIRRFSADCCGNSMASRGGLPMTSSCGSQKMLRKRPSTRRTH